MASVKEWPQKMVAKYCHAVALKVALRSQYLTTSPASNPESLPTTKGHLLKQSCPFVVFR